MYLSDPLDEFAIITTLIGLVLGGYFAYRAIRHDRDDKAVLAAFDEAFPRLKIVFALANIFLYPLIIKVILGIYHPISALSESFLPDLLGLIGLGLIWISVCAAGTVFIIRFIFTRREPNG
jgi:hypothetical protein